PDRRVREAPRARARRPVPPSVAPLERDNRKTDEKLTVRNSGVKGNPADPAPRENDLPCTCEFCTHTHAPGPSPSGKWVALRLRVLHTHTRPTGQGKRRTVLPLVLGNSTRTKFRTSMSDSFSQAPS